MFFNLRLFFSSALALLAIVAIVAANPALEEKRQITSDVVSSNVGVSSVVQSSPTNVVTSSSRTPTPSPTPPPPPTSGALPRSSFTLLDVGLALGGIALGAMITLA